MVLHEFQQRHEYRTRIREEMLEYACVADGADMMSCIRWSNLTVGLVAGIVSIY